MGLIWWLRWYRICLQCRRPGFDPWVRKTPLEKGVGSHSSIFGWRIPWTEVPGDLQSTGLQRVRHDWGTFTSLHSLSIFRSWITGSKLQSYFSVCSLDSIQSFCDLTGHVTAQEVWIWGVAFAFSSSLFWIMFLLLCRLPLWLSRWRIRLQCGRPGFDSWVGKIPWRQDSGLQYSGPENSMDYIVRGVAKSRTWLSNFDFT